MTQADGLYRVVTRYLCAGFVVEEGRVTLCAPILRRNLAYWRTVAELQDTPSLCDNSPSRDGPCSKEASDGPAHSPRLRRHWRLPDP